MVFSALSAVRYMATIGQNFKCPYSLSVNLFNIVYAPVRCFALEMHTVVLAICITSSNYFTKLFYSKDTKIKS